jgi:hypothetical protein
VVAVARVAIVLRRVLIIAFPGAAGRGYRTAFFFLESERPDRKFGSREDSGDNSFFPRHVVM